jgi:hypothetical protein
MAKSTEALTDEEQRRVYAVAPDFHFNRDLPRPCDVFHFTIHTGYWPIVLAHAAEFRLRLEIQDNGHWHAVCNRPKKEGNQAYSPIPLPDDCETAGCQHSPLMHGIDTVVAPPGKCTVNECPCASYTGIMTWYPTFVQWLNDNPRTTKFYLEMMTELGNAAGVPGLSMRGLRHTFLMNIGRATGDVEQVKRLGNCSLRVAVMYTRGAVRDRDSYLYRDGSVPRGVRSAADRLRAEYQGQVRAMTGGTP